MWAHSAAESSTSSGPVLTCPWLLLLLVLLVLALLLPAAPACCCAAGFMAWVSKEATVNKDRSVLLPHSAYCMRNNHTWQTWRGRGGGWLEECWLSDEEHEGSGKGVRVSTCIVTTPTPVW